MGLEAKLEALTQRVEALEAKLTPKAPPPPQMVGFDRPLPRAAVAASGFKMPSEAELRQLMARVHAAHPKLADLDGLAERGDDAIDADFINFKGDIRRAIFAKQFRLAFIALSHFRRTEEPDMRRYVSYWQDEAASVLAGLGQPSETLKFNPFVTAALAHGDIPFCGCKGFARWAEGSACQPAAGRPRRPNRSQYRPVSKSRHRTCCDNIPAAMGSNRKRQPSSLRNKHLARSRRHSHWLLARMQTNTFKPVYNTCGLRQRRPTMQNGPRPFIHGRRPFRQPGDLETTRQSL